jgi:NTP pyrophosphatase (non-canonical NTP hydrolase)
METLNVGALIAAQRAFVAERKWDKFHTPKNLSMALTGEAAELLEIFQWLSEAESREVMKNPVRARAVTDELADIFFYVLRIADTLNIDLEQAFTAKMIQNRAKYPVTPQKRLTKKQRELLITKGLHSR